MRAEPAYWNGHEHHDGHDDDEERDDDDDCDDDDDRDDDDRFQHLGFHHHILQITL